MIMKEGREIIRTRRWRWFESTGALALVISIVAALPCLASDVPAGGTPVEARRSIRRNILQKAFVPIAQRNDVQRINLPAGNRREIIYVEPIASVVIIDPDIATAEISNDRNVVIAGLTAGTTILIVSGKSGRTTYAIDVDPPLAVAQPQTALERRNKIPETSSGTSTFAFIPGLSGGSSFLRHNFEYSQKLQNGRTLRLGSEMLRYFGKGNRTFSLPPGAAAYGANRLKLGLDSPTSKLDLLDSELEISPIGFNGYTLRGPHFVANSNSDGRGLEIFAGNARPQYTLLNQGKGRLAGAIVPVYRSRFVHVRAGIFFISPVNRSAIFASENSADKHNGGMILQVDALYSPDDRTKVEGEAAYGNSGLSWRARADLRRGPITFFGELSHLDRRSPMIAVGAQSTGSTSSSFNIQWQPDVRFSAGVSYNRTVTPTLATTFTTSDRIRLNSRAFSISASFSPASRSRLGLSFNQQKINTPAAGLIPFLLDLQTRNAVIKYDRRFNKRWTNGLEAQLIISREIHTDTAMNRGFSIREHLGYAGRLGSITGFVNYRSNTPSMESILLRSPALIPAVFRQAFAADPQGFLMKNRDTLPLLLNGIEIPLTRSSESGIRMYSTFSRLNFTGEMVYGSGKFMTRRQRTFGTTLSTNFRLDAANSIQIGASRGFTFGGAGTSRTAMTFSYVHRFGAGSGGGFQFSRLLGSGRGKIRGRVFLDLNGNGQEDTGETGLAGIKLQLNSGKIVITDTQGSFNFGLLSPGDFDIALISDLLGATLRASSPTLQNRSLSPGQTINLSFGLTDSGVASGRIFNDLLLAGKETAGEAPGISGVKLVLRAGAGTIPAMPNDNPLFQISDGNGIYEFRNLAPGKYIMDIDPSTLPADFHLPKQMSWAIVIAPLQSLYLDLPIAAQRAVAGTVYIDRDNNGRFDPEKDLSVEGARIVAGKSEALSNRQGSYLLKNLPAGRIEIRIFSPEGKEGDSIRLELGQEPAIRMKTDLVMQK